jgi:hypothetical protein
VNAWVPHLEGAGRVLLVTSAGVVFDPVSA